VFPSDAPAEDCILRLRPKHMRRRMWTGANKHDVMM
jgi:hypothetical protein